jgi:hypothetical protein
MSTATASIPRPARLDARETVEIEPRSAPADNRAEELFDGLLYAISGAGIGFLTFLGAIPGLLPCVALVGAAGLLLLIPLLVVGLVVGVIAGVVLAIAKLGSWARGRVMRF